MIQQSSFLGLPLRTQRQRRMFVLFYAAIVLTLSSLPLIKGRWEPWFFIMQAINLTGMLGGLRIGGPIKPFEQPAFVPSNQNSRFVQTLNLEGRKPFDDTYSSQFEPLDERETLRRDRSHYNAYRLLRFALVLLVLLYAWGYAEVPQWLARNTPTLLWMLVIVVLSLPQCVLLWTEPEEPAGELAAVK